MKKVVKNFNNAPAILTSATCVALQASALIEKSKHEFNPEMYGHIDVRTALNAIYNSKCAFCETDPSAGMTIQVEHFRPKARVTGIKLHPGYYWLGYEWSNLLLACSSCNSKKRSQFPIDIIGVRVSEPPTDVLLYRVDGTELMGELALILNPETIMDVKTHFTYLPNGKIVPITSEAIKTEEKIGLNRGNLVKARKKILDTCLKNIMKSFDDLEKRVITTEQELEYGIMLRIRDLIVISADNLPYSQFAEHCWINFKEYVVDIFKEPQQLIVHRVYQRVKAINQQV